MQQQTPPYAASLMANDPKMADMLAANREFILADGALSAKVKTLMTMLCDALLAHENGVSVIADRARAMGASEEEIAETIRVAFLMGGLPAPCYRRQRLQGRIAAASRSPYRLCADLRLIDAPGNRIAVQCCDDVVRGHLPHAPNRLAACAGYVRREQHVFQAPAAGRRGVSVQDRLHPAPRPRFCRASAHRAARADPQCARAWC